MIFRVHYQTAEPVPHVYCSLYVARGPNQTFALCGSFTIRKDEFEPLREAFSKVEFVKVE